MKKHFLEDESIPKHIRDDLRKWKEELEAKGHKMTFTQTEGASITLIPQRKKEK